MLRRSAEEPQRIYHRDRLVGALIGVELFEDFERWLADRRRHSLGRCLAHQLWPITRNACDFEGCGIPLLDPFAGLLITTIRRRHPIDSAVTLEEAKSIEPLTSNSPPMAFPAAS